MEVCMDAPASAPPRQRPAPSLLAQAEALWQTLFGALARSPEDACLARALAHVAEARDLLAHHAAAGPERATGGTLGALQGHTGPPAKTGVAPVLP